MENILQKHKQRIAAIYQQLRNDPGILDDHFIDLVQFIIEARQEEAAQLMEDYNFTPSDSQNYRQLQSLLMQINRSLRNFPIFQRLKMIKECLSISLRYPPRFILNEQNGIYWLKGIEASAINQGQAEPIQKEKKDIEFNKNAILFRLMNKPQIKPIYKILFAVISKDQEQLYLQSQKNISKIMPFYEDTFSKGKITLFLLKENQSQGLQLKKNQSGMIISVYNYIFGSKTIGNRFSFPFFHNKCLFITGNGVNYEAIWRLATILVEHMNERMEQTDGINFLNELISYKMENYEHLTLKNNIKYLPQIISQTFLRSQFGAQFLYSMERQDSDSILRQYFKRRQFKNNVPFRPLFIQKYFQQAEHPQILKYKKFRQRLKLYLYLKNILNLHEEEIQNILRTPNNIQFYLVISKMAPKFYERNIEILHQVIVQSLLLDSLDYFIILCSYYRNYIQSNSNGHEVKQKQIFMALGEKIQKQKSQQIISETPRNYKTQQFLFSKMTQLLLRQDGSYIRAQSYSYQIYQIFKQRLSCHQIFLQLFNHFRYKFLQSFINRPLKTLQLVEVLLSHPSNHADRQAVLKIINCNQKLIEQMFTLINNSSVDCQALIQVLTEAFSNNQIKASSIIINAFANINKVDQDKQLTALSLIEQVSPFIFKSLIINAFNENAAIFELNNLLKAVMLIKFGQCRQIIIRRLIDKLVFDYNNMEAHKMLLKLLQKSTLNQQRKQEIQNIVYEDDRFDWAITKPHIKNAMINNPNLLRSLKNNKNVFQKFLIEVAESLIRNQITLQELKKIKNNMPIIIQISKKIRFDQIIKQVQTKVEKLQKNSKHLIEILEKYKLFNEQIKLIYDCLTLLEKQVIMQAFNKASPLENILQQSQRLFYFRDSIYWQQKEINTLADLTSLGEKSYLTFVKQIDFFEKGDISYSAFKRQYIDEKNIQKMLSFANHKQKLTGQIMSYVKLFSDQSLNKYQQFISVYCYITQDLLGKDIDQFSQQFKKFLFKIKEQPHLLQVRHLNAELQTNINRLSSILLSKKLKSKTTVDQIKQISQNVVYQIFRSTFKCRELLDFYKNDKINLEEIQQLNEYLEDIESSEVTLEAINQLKRVIECFQIYEKSKGIMEINKNMENLAKAEKFPLSQCIQNCQSAISSIKRIMWKAKNREFSFKIQVQEMLRSSRVILSQIDGQIMLQVDLGVEVSQSKFQSGKKHLIWTDMLGYKQKSMLMIKDIQKTQVNAKTAGTNSLETLQTFKQCINKLEKLYNYVKEMITLGYDISLIEIHFMIKSSDLSKLDRALQEYQSKHQNWKKFVKDIYRKSYFLTHFIGPQLSNFKRTFLNFQYLPFYKNILKIDQVRFARSLKYDDKLLKLKQCIEDQKESIKQEDILLQIKQIFDQFNQNDKAMQESTSISIIVCQSRFYYSCLLQKQDVAEVTQVLICQSHTTPQQIECFIYRALLQYTRRHYIISCYDLNEQARSQMLDLLIGLNNSKELQKAKLTFIASKTNDKIIGALTKRNVFSSVKRQLTEKQIDKQAKLVLEPLKNSTMIIQSQRAGLGKTFYAQNIAKQKKKSLVYFPVCGNIQLKILSLRLKKIIKDFRGGKQDTKLAVLIQIGMVENKKQLQVFLSQIILFRSFYYQQYIFLPEETEIYVQIQNHYQDHQEKDEYHIINLLKKYCMTSSYKKINQFRLEQICFSPQNDKENFTLAYLQLLEKNQIEKIELVYVDPLSANHRKLNPLPEKQSRMLIQKYFFQWFNGKSKPTYHTFNFFMKILFNLFKAFGESPFLMLFNFQDIHAQYNMLRLKEARTKFLHTCIQNTLQFLEESITTNCFGNGLGQLRQFNQKMKQNNLLIVPTAGFHGYQFVYSDDSKVPFVIKSLLIKETAELNAISTKIRNDNHVNQFFRKTALNQSSGENLTMMILSKLSHITGNQKFQSQFYDKLTKTRRYHTFQEMLKRIPELKDYKLTLDNFFKMCLIMLRSLCDTPIIIMGESGVGKTALIKFLVEVVYEQILIVKNVHAGIHYDNIQSWMSQIIDESQKISNEQKLWVFFDEFNTSDQLSYFKEILIDKRFNGQELPSNIIFLAACNPYRQRKQVRKQHGLNYVPKNREVVQNNLAFKVKPPSISMIQLMWDYQQLKQSEIQQYVVNMLRGIKYKQLDKLIKLIVEIHEIFKIERQISSVSLRDVYRFVELFRWFQNSIPNGKNNKNKKKHKKKGKGPDQNRNQLGRSQRAIILSIVFCYGLKIQSRSARKRIIQLAEKRLQYTEGRISQIFQEQLQEYVSRLQLNDEKIASNTTLNQNLFTTLVCLNNKIPILIIGNPGSSKSLSVRMIDSHLKGKQSKAQFCQQFPKVNMFYFQGSQSSTSQGVEQIFKKAEEKERQTRQYNQKIGEDKQSFINCILFDQIGLAEKSVHNPLKVLHSKLETREKAMGFIGISNYELDSAKMSRFLVLAHTEPDRQQLQSTAHKIFQSYDFESEKMQKYSQKFKQLGGKYYQFINQWNKEKGNTKHFFGLRDFYSFIKNVCQQLQKDSGFIEDFNNIVANSIAMNFDGQKGSVQMFLKLMDFQKSKIQILNPIQMVKKNLGKNQSRCLMLIVKSDALIPLINQNIEVNGEKRQVECFYGSTFEDDKESEDYNLQATSKIIAQLSRGTILVFKDINNSIQTSLYDLFNKSYVRRGKYKTCRIAVGANSNPKCIVHDNFNAIIYVQQENIPHLDLPFINRFQKHQLSIKSMATQEDLQLFRSTTEWISNFLKNKPAKCTLTQSSFLINCRQQAIMTLIIKLRGSKNRENDIRVKILQNKTTDFDILMNCQKEAITKQQISSYTNQIVPWNQNKEDLIIYTYDLFESVGENLASLRIRQFKTQKSLRKQLETIFTYKAYNKLQIILNYQKQYQHLNFILFLARQLKISKESNIQIIIIVQVVRRALQSNKVQALNISYIHNYDQYFVEDMQCKSDILTIIRETKTVWDLFLKLNIFDKMPEIQFQSLKCLKLVQQKQNSEQLKEIIYQLSELSNQNQSYRQILNKCLKESLSKQLINLEEMQSNAEISIYSSNIAEALETYAFSYIKNILIGFQYLIIRGGVTFNPIKIINMKDDFHQQQLFQQQNKRAIDFLQSIFQKRLEEALHEMEGVEIKNKITSDRRLQNRVLVQVPLFQSLVPQSFQDFSLIFSMKNRSSYSIESAFGIFKIQSTMDEQQLAKMKFELKIAENHFLKSNYYRILEQIQSGLTQKIDELYFYDIFMFALSRIEINLSAEGQWLLFDFFKQLLEEHCMLQKLVIIVFDTDLFSQIIILLNLLFKKTNFKRLIDIWKNSLRQCKDNFIVYWKTFTQICLRQCFLKIQINKQNFNDNDDNYSKQKRQFREYYDKCKCISRNYPQIAQFQVETSIQAFYFLIQFQQNLNKTIQKPISIIDHYLSQNEGSIFLKAFKIVESVLQNKELESCKDLVINYLSYYLFTDWFQYILQEEDEKEICYRKFIWLCNKYSLFANNSVFYLDQIFGNLSNLSNFCKILQALESNDRFQYFNNDCLTLKDNLSVAIGNYFNMIISKTQQIYEQQREDAEEFLRTYFHLFQTFLREKEELNLLKIFKFQFSKIYAGIYTKSLLADEWFDVSQNIDALLSIQRESSKHIKVYILKLLYKDLKKIQIINEKFLKVQKCRWIKNTSDLISETKQNFFLPRPVILEEKSQQTQEFRRMLIQLEDTKYDIQLFNHVIRQVMKQDYCSLDCYDLLTFFLTKIYNKSICPSHICDLLKSQLQNRRDINEIQNVVLFRLLMGYLTGNIGRQISFSEQSYNDQLIMLNYFNYIVSFRRHQNNPLVEMFFTADGLVALDYADWIADRYLLGSIPHPALLRLEFIRKQHQKKMQGNSYTICSSNCDYLTPIGGNFYGGNDGCAHSINSSKCPYCDGVVGAVSYNKLAREGEGARMISKEDVLLQRERIGLKTQANFIFAQQKRTLLLKGYQNGFRQRQIRQSTELYRHFTESSTDHLQKSNNLVINHLISSISNFCWYTLSSLGLINQQSFSHIWRATMQQQNISQLLKNSKFYLQIVQRQLFPERKHEQFILWNLGMNRRLMVNLYNFQNQHKFTLRDALSRDHFQMSLKKRVQKYLDIEKQELIKSNRVMMQIDKSDIIREEGDLQTHQIQYSFIRMFKITSDRPTFRSLKQFTFSLDEHYPFLAQITRLNVEAGRLECYANIFHFLYLLRKIFNHQITRIESKKSLRQMIFLRKDLEEYELQANCKKFIQSWNSLAKDKFLLELDCHSSKTLGNLPQISIDTALKFFLFDRNTVNSESAQRLIAFTIIASRNYNMICSNLNAIYQRAYPQLDNSLFSQIKLNPSHLDNKKNMLYFNSQSFQRIVQIYASQTVQYGLSTCHYPFEIIQRRIVRQLYGKRLLEIERDQFQYFNFVGEQIQFIAELRINIEQKTLEQLKQLDLIEKYIADKQKQDPSGQYKLLRNLKKYLESLVVFYTTLNLEINVKKNLKQVVLKYKIKGIDEEFLEILGQISESGLANLYQLIEYYSFEYVLDMLDACYKKDLTKDEEKSAKQLLQHLKANKIQQLPSYKDFKIAVYRFAGRHVTLQISNQTQRISDYLCEVPEYWPKDINHKKIGDELKHKLADLSLESIGSLLRLMPFKEAQIQKRNAPIKQEKVSSAAPKLKAKKDR